MSNRSDKNLHAARRKQVDVQNRFTYEFGFAPKSTLKHARDGGVKRIYSRYLGLFWGDPELLDQLFFFSLSVLPIRRYTSDRLPELANHVVPAGAEVVVEEMQSQLLLNHVRRLSVICPQRLVA